MQSPSLIASSDRKNAADIVHSLRSVRSQSTRITIMKNKIYLISGVCVVSLVFCLPLTAQTLRTQSSPAASPHATAGPASSPSKQAAHPIPFHGMVSAVDQNTKTFTIAGKKASRVFKVTDKSTITKGRNAATIKDIAQNEEVSGSAWKNPDGSLEAKTVKLGPAEKAKPLASPTASPTAPKP